MIVEALYPKEQRTAGVRELGPLDEKVATRGDVHLPITVFGELSIAVGDLHSRGGQAIKTPLQCDGIGGMPSSLKLSDSGQTPKEIIFVFTSIYETNDSSFPSILSQVIFPRIMSDTDEFPTSGVSRP
ncbi:hypothetical protein G4B88_014585 [Cannabis sativa]|uniref:Uncharacterized protein n=1 Tax=Cannabis sativa TaxID=3483 RepID=A0A7J6IAU5_CANSA|nr:hypothetical protein G4B88_014585 [Cannabis sativa]